MCPSSHGLRVTPHVGDSVHGTAPSSGMSVLPITIAPAARIRRTISESAFAGSPYAFVPNVLTSPATSNSSFTAIGTPSRGRSTPPPPPPRSAAALPARSRASAWSASIRARSANTTLKAFNAGFEALDPLQVDVDQLAGGDLARGDQLRLPGDPGVGEVDCVHAANLDERKNRHIRPGAH